MKYKDLYIFPVLSSGFLVKITGFIVIRGSNKEYKL